MAKTNPWRLVLAVAIIALTMTALCGCGSHDNAPDPPAPAPSGQVAGQVRYFTTNQGLGNVYLTVGGRTGISNNNGDFLITGITPGDSQVLTVDPPDWLALPSQDPIYVNVVLNQTTTLPWPILLIDAGGGPPDPPS